MLRILIADDHPVVRRGLKQLLYDEPDVAIVGEAKSADEVFKLVRTQIWDAVILDISMPGIGGIETLEELKRQYPALPVLMLSTHPEDQYATWAFKAGASGYLSKESALDELAKAVRKITQGGRYVSDALAEKSVVLRGAEPPSQENLSAGEFRVMLRIASGETLSQIAAEMALSMKTVSTYRAHILEKMQLQSNAEITQYAIKHGLIK